MSENARIREGKKLLSEAYLWKTRSEKAKLKFDDCRSRLASFFRENRDVETLEVDDETLDNGVIVAKLSERISSLNYDVDALRASLGKEQFNEVVHKTYQVVDIDKLVSLLKNAGVSPSEFKQIIHIAETPDKAAIQQLFALGDITTEQLKGTYSATISQSVNISKKVRKGG